MEPLTNSRLPSTVAYTPSTRSSCDRSRNAYKYELVVAVTAASCKMTTTVMDSSYLEQLYQPKDFTVSHLNYNKFIYIVQLDIQCRCINARGMLPYRTCMQFAFMSEYQFTSDRTSILSTPNTYRCSSHVRATYIINRDRNRENA